MRGELVTCDNAVSVEESVTRRCCEAAPRARVKEARQTQATPEDESSGSATSAPRPEAKSKLGPTQRDHCEPAEVSWRLGVGDVLQSTSPDEVGHEK